MTHHRPTTVPAPRRPVVATPTPPPDGRRRRPHHCHHGHRRRSHRCPNHGPRPRRHGPRRPRNRRRRHRPGRTPSGPTVTDAALDSIFGQLVILRSARIAHGALSTRTIVVDDDRDRRVRGLPHGLDGGLRRPARPGRGSDSWPRRPWWPGPERPLAAAAAVGCRTEVMVGALPYLQRAALDPVASRSPPRQEGHSSTQPARAGGDGGRRRGAQAGRAPTHQLGHPGPGGRDPDRRLGPDRRADQRGQVVEHDHRCRLGLGGGHLRPGPGRVPGHRHHHRGLGDQPPPVRAHRGPRAVRHLRGPGRRVHGRAGHPGAGSSSRRGTRRPWR